MKIFKALVVLILSFVTKIIVYIFTLIATVLYIIRALVNVVIFTVEAPEKALQEEVINKLIEWQRVSEKQPKD